MVEPVELRTERLLLRPFREGDIDDVYAFANDPEWSRYLMNVPDTYTRAHAQEFIDRNLGRDWDTNPNFALVLDGCVVGHIGLVVSKEHQRAEIGYSIARTHWGKGLVPEALRDLRLAVRYASSSTNQDARRRAQQALLAGDGEAGHDPRRPPAAAPRRPGRPRRRGRLRTPTRGVGGAPGLDGLL